MFNFVYALILILFFAGRSFAGDFAEREILGFSTDGRLFAFEEYGTQDGSGFSYSSIYMIDTTTDKWVKGSPWRTTLEDEAADVEEARAVTRQKAGDALKQITQKGFLAATNRHTEIQPDPSRLIANPRSYVPSGASNLEYRLSVFDIYVEPKENDYCRDFGGPKGFRLTQIFPDQEKATRILHNDKTLPSSRNCPLNYRFADLVTYFPRDASQKAPPVVAILILMETVGFEGPDGRFLAVTATLE